MKDSSLWLILQKMRLPFAVILITYTIAMIGLVLIPGVDDKGDVYHFSIFEAFYFVTYTATTIGFGEVPYAFTHAQKIWVSISIYLTVLGWFYGMGTLVSLLQNKLFLSEIAVNKFRRSVKNIKEDFVIILGYNETTSKIIQKMINSKTRVVVIEKEQQRAEYLMLEGFIPHVPVLVADVHSPKSLEDSGINSIYCKGIISLFDNNILNLRVTLASKLLNPNVTVAVRATTEAEAQNLLDAGANIIENPFKIISNQMQMALNAPSLFKIKNWLYKHNSLEGKTFSIPNTNILICGYGRLGRYLNKMFESNNISPTIIDKDTNQVEVAKQDGVKNFVLGDAENKYDLKKVNIQSMELILVTTNDDTTNLSIISTVKKLNKNIIIITRENEMSDFSIFANTKVDHIFIPSYILIRKTTNALLNPLSDKMIRVISKKDEQWAKKLLYKLIKKIDQNPITYELNIEKQSAIELYHYLKNENHKLTLDTILSSRRDRMQKNNIFPLLLVRDDTHILLPNNSIELQVNDKILFACDENGRDDLEYIVNNVYEFHYIVTGEEKKYFNKFISRK